MKFKLSRLSSTSKGNNKQFGFTLIELIIAIAVIGTGVGGVLAYQNRAESAQNTIVAVQALASLGGTIKTTYNSAYVDATRADIVTRNLLRPPLRVGATATTLESPVGVVDYINNDQVVGFGFDARRQSECVKAVEALIGVAHRIAVGGTLVAAGTTPAASLTATAPAVAWDTVTNIPTRADISTACGARQTVQFLVR
jgi:prepilin-type N-terminal cleavage/methylation domain-containing protein